MSDYSEILIAIAAELRIANELKMISIINEKPKEEQMEAVQRLSKQVEQGRAAARAELHG